jgi:hypothetical protein
MVIGQNIHKYSKRQQESQDFTSREKHIMLAAYKGFNF